MSEIKIKQGMSRLTDFINQSVYVRFPYIQLDLQSTRSYYSYYLTQLMVKEIQDTVSSYRVDEVWEYLYDNYDLEELKGLYSWSTKKYLLTNQKVIDYASILAKNTKLKEDLQLLSDVIRYKDNIADIEELLASIKNNERPRNISPAGYLNNGRIKYRPKYDVTKANVLEVAGNSKVNARYICDEYYNELSRIVGLTDDWVFLEGMSRRTEVYYLEAILDGHIRATTKEGIKVQDEYTRLKSVKGVDFLYIATQEARIKEYDKVFEELTADNKEVKGLNDYVIYYSEVLTSEAQRRPKYEASIITGLYAYDFDNQEILPTINRILGITGEFSRINTSECKYPTMVIDSNYNLVEMWRVEEVYDIAFEDFEISDKEPLTSPYQEVSHLLKSDTLNVNINEISRVENKKIYNQIDLYGIYAQMYDKMTSDDTEGVN